MKKTENFNMRVDADFVQKVDDWRRIQADIPPRAEAIRRMVDLAIKAESQIDSLEEDIATLRTVAREWAEKAGAPKEVLDAIDSADPGAASSNPWLRKMDLKMDAQDMHVRSVEKPPRQKFPKPPKKL